MIGKRYAVAYSTGLSGANMVYLSYTTIIPINKNTKQAVTITLKLNININPIEFEGGERGPNATECSFVSHFCIYRYNEAAIENFAISDYSMASTDPSPDNLLFILQSISTLPTTTTSNTSSAVAEIRLHPSGDWLYVSNRGHNSITVYSVNKDEGTLTMVQVKDSEGLSPRHFNFDLSGK